MAKGDNLLPENSVNKSAQRRNPAEIAFVALAQSNQLDDATITEFSGLFALWDAGSKYAAGDIRQYNGNIYRCLQSHSGQADWTPDKAASLWVKIADPAEEWPPIPNPLTSTNPWMKGQKGSTADGRKWVSLIDNNVWQPTDYPAGWSEVK